MTRAEQIDHILDRFDFERVRKVMLALNWTWSDEDEPCIPTVTKMRRTARELLKRVVAANGETLYTGTGGFVARMDRDGDLSLEFVAEETWCFNR